MRSRHWPEKLFDGLLWAQGLYFALTGLWPLISIESFQAVTGQKTDHLVTGREGDHWLVMTVGALVTAISISLLFAAWRKARQLEIAILAIMSAMALAAIDIIYVSRGVLNSIYLVDAAAEVTLLILWLIVLTTRIG